MTWRKDHESSITLGKSTVDATGICSWCWNCSSILRLVGCGCECHSFKNILKRFFNKVRK